MSRNLQKAWILGQSRMGKPTEKWRRKQRRNNIFKEEEKRLFSPFFLKKREQCWLLGPGAPYLGHRRHSEHLNSRRGRKLSIFHHSPCFLGEYFYFYFVLEIPLLPAAVPPWLHVYYANWNRFLYLYVFSSARQKFIHMVHVLWYASMLFYHFNAFIFETLCSDINLYNFACCCYMRYWQYESNCTSGYIGVDSDHVGGSVSNFKGYFGKQSVGGWRRLWNDNCDINTCWNTHAT